MSEYHEPTSELADDTRDEHRALTSLQEELEAVDWYQQRLSCCKDADLKRILEHNRNEEFEHAAMLIEWLRRRRPEFEQRLSQIVFTGRTLGVELGGNEAESAGKKPMLRGQAGRGLGIGSLRGTES